MNLHTDLLRQARHLTSREPKRPLQVSLRRAVSGCVLRHLPPSGRMIPRMDADKARVYPEYYIGGVAGPVDGPDASHVPGQESGLAPQLSCTGIRPRRHEDGGSAILAGKLSSKLSPGLNGERPAAGNHPRRYRPSSTFSRPVTKPTTTRLADSRGAGNARPVGPDAEMPLPTGETGPKEHPGGHLPRRTAGTFREQNAE